MPRCVSRAAFVLVLFAAATVHAQTVDEIIAKNLQAKGGEKWKAVTAVKMTGKIAIQAGPQPLEGQLTLYAKRPNFNRQEITIKDMQVVQAFDGTTAWTINPLMGIQTPTEVPGGVSEMTRNHADFDGVFMNYKEKGHKVDLVGKETLAGAEVYHLKVTMKSGHEAHYFIDTNTGLEVKQRSELDLGTGQKQAIENELSNYQPVNGIMVPHTMKQSVDGKPLVEMTIEKVEINATIDDAVFRMKK